MERREITTINRSGDIRARLLATLSQVTDINPIELDQASSLLEEIQRAPVMGDIAAPAAVSVAATALPTGGALPPERPPAPVPHIHTIPHIGSPKNSDVVTDFDS